MLLDNVRFIRPEDFGEEFQEQANRLATVLNPFMQQVFDLTSGRIDFENTTQSTRTIQMTVGANGTPVGNNQVSLPQINGIRGITVIRARNLTNPNLFPTGQPFITFSQVNQGLIQVTNIAGLPPSRYELTLIIY